MRQTFFSLLFLALATCFSAKTSFGNQPDTSSAAMFPDSLILLEDDPILAALDSVLAHELFCLFGQESDTAILNTWGYQKDSVPKIEAEYVAQQLALLDGQTPFNLVYNKHVQGFVNLYTIRKRNLTSRILGLTSLYFPMIEEALDRHEMPLELKYLAIVESALRPTARSRAGAVGLWQFMYRTGKIYDLQVNSYVDDRMNPYKATEAACQYLKFLHGIYDNWELALAAYNCGPGNVNRAIRRSGGKKNYWELWPYLPKETRGYVPAFIAVNYVMNNPSVHNIYPVVPTYSQFEVDTVWVSQQLTYEQLTATLEVNEPMLRYLNPMYKEGIIPNTVDKNVLVLPCDKVGDFIVNEESIYNYNLHPEDSAEITEPLVAVQVRKTHVVKRGEYLGSIAQRYNCKVSDLKDWNGLRSTRLMPGQRLVLFVTEDAVAKQAPKTESKNGSTYYTVQKGDTLWDIAKANGISVGQLRSMNTTLMDRNLKPGTKIVVGKKG